MFLGTVIRSDLSNSSSSTKADIIFSSAPYLAHILPDTCFSVALQPYANLGLLTVEVPKSQPIRHTYLLGLHWTSEQLVAETATYTTHTKTSDDLS